MGFLFNPQSLAADEAAIAEINQGTKWAEGESVPIYVGKDAGGANIEIKRGSSASPDTVFKSSVRVSRTLAVPESSFGGDGQIGLGSITGVTQATAASEGQALGIVGGAVTASSKVGTHSQADAFGGYFVGRSTSASTRTGGGLFVLGQRNNVEGRATGMEIGVENNTASAGTVLEAEYMNTQGFWVTPRGESDSAAAFVIGHPTEKVFKAGTVLQKNAVSEAGFLDYSSALRSIQIKGAHSKAAISVASGAGSVAVGAEEVTVANALLDIYFGESALTPGVVFGTDKAKNVSVRVRNSTGELNSFAANTAGQFVTDSTQGDTGLSFSPGKVLRLGAVGKASQLRIGEASLGFFATAPIAKPEVTGSRTAGAALTSLLEKLAALGLITNGTTA